MLTPEQRQYSKELGIKIDHLTDSEIIDEILKQAHLLALSAEFTDKDYLRREIARSLKPNN